jgi:hypothetical protein
MGQLRWQARQATVSGRCVGRTVSHCQYVGSIAVTRPTEGFPYREFGIPRTQATGEPPTIPSIIDRVFSCTHCAAHWLHETLSTAALKLYLYPSPAGRHFIKVSRLPISLDSGPPADSDVRGYSHE